MFDKLRGKKSPLDLKPGQPIWAIDPTIEDQAVNFNTVLEWLIGLGDDDYNKVVKVSGIHRKAYGDAADALGEPLDPTTFINPPEPVSNMVVVDKDVHHLDHKRPKTMLDDDDELNMAFLDDDDQQPKKKTSKPVKVQDDK